SCATKNTTSYASLLRRLLHPIRIIEQNPFDYRDWQTAVLDQVSVELTKPKIVALSIFVAAEQIHDLPFAGDVSNFLRWACSRTGCFAFGCFAIQSTRVHKILDGLFESPSAGVQIYID